MAGVGQVVYGSDYNTVQVKVREILNDGSPLFGTYGWNQPTQSSLVAPYQAITQAQWQALANDVNKCYLHAYNTNFPSYPTITVGQSITYANLTLIDGVISPFVSTQSTRNTAAAGQKTQTQQGPSTGVVNLTNTRNSAWGSGNSSITGAFRVDFADAPTLQYFFNQGGSIQISGFGPNLSGSVQDADWSTFLTSFRFSMNYVMYASVTGTNANMPGYPLTDTSSSSGKYTSNTITVQCYQSGGSLYFTVIYTDAHVASGAGPDSVSAGAGYYVYTTKATGAFTGYDILASSATITAF